MLQEHVEFSELLEKENKHQLVENKQNLHDSFQ